MQAQNPASELYDLLLQNSSIFGRLIHIASLWNPETRRYEKGLPERFRNGGLDSLISRWHQAFFLEWLALSLDQQQRDVDLYWTSKGRARPEVSQLRELGEAAIPPLVDWAERQAFSKNLAFIQSVLSHEANRDSTAA
jgi:hypothetical protein